MNPELATQVTQQTDVIVRRPFIFALAEEENASWS
jgi:hypothetical protein